MNRVLFVIVAVLFLFHSSHADVFAQRTSAQRVHVGLSQVATINNKPSGGLQIEAGQYLLNSYWSAGAKITNWNCTTDVEETYFDYVLWGVQGGWNYRIISTYSRILNVYAGADAFIGCNHYEVFKKLPQEYSGGFPTTEFAYGIEPSLECEVFLGSRTAITFGAQLPIIFTGYFSSGKWHPTASLGLRINL